MGRTLETCRVSRLRGAQMAKAGLASTGAAAEGSRNLRQAQITAARPKRLVEALAGFRAAKSVKGYEDGLNRFAPKSCFPRKAAKSDAERAARSEDPEPSTSNP